MATLRQPFAPLDGSRLQALTSLRNKQSALSPQPFINTKRKAADPSNLHDLENFDPGLFSKRSKGSRGTSILVDRATYPCLSIKTTTATPPLTYSTSLPRNRLISSPRPIREAKPPSAKLAALATRPRASTTPAGRSPTRGKRAGLLSRHRTLASSYRRHDPPGLVLGKGKASFSLDTALKGTVPSYSSRQLAAATPAQTLNSICDTGLAGSWTFDIHEDTHEQDMTNLLQHSTCVLDISSDEESEQKVMRDQAEGRDKENIPPADDLSQTSRTSIKARRVVVLAVSDRVALAEMSPEGFYGDGCHDASVFIVPADEEDDDVSLTQVKEPVTDFEFAPQLVLSDRDQLLAEAELIQSSKAAVLQPIEGTGESFDFWESSSTKDVDETTAVLNPEPLALFV